MNMHSKTLLAAAGIAAVAFSPAYAGEGFIATKPGAFIGSSAGVPPPGIYMFNQVFTYQANFAGPGTAAINPPGTQKTGVHVNVDAQGFLFVPGWTFLGATYDAVIVQPFVDLAVGIPGNQLGSGAFNTYIVPVELSWNRATHYTSGDIFHVDITATKTIGKWTFGPVAYYVAQVTDDKCPLSCIATGDSVLLHAQRFSEWAVGGLVGYDFGPASFSVWATQEINAKASNHFAAPGTDPSLVAEGATVFATLSYRLWAPEAPVAPAMYHK